MHEYYLIYVKKKVKTKIYRSHHLKMDIEYINMQSYHMLLNYTCIFVIICWYYVFSSIVYFLSDEEIGGYEILIYILLRLVLG